ncbi:MAG: prolyl-tRNA synthetase [Candidatus Magasanikbacteria bacterium CG10_big_fil_rev_8_21_14_0_10_36_32]|uniref:Proline--tRNA ligase n=1 Tax=Candidatus Magasanikbacteria bacterium CG10_big_fil_rev_8_21_14_0_10_36_32 TaxID=1974646 RepID=A0A2M6W7V4_9BACT|nr:MAG: prolyl-tRNA synthetase [Candidatus Magasanikbacteria bacterium CG10_big_fil_rev_8_21_14_0_10_36_32]
MKFSQMFGKTSKTVPADADSTNAKLLTRGGFIMKQTSGIYNYLPLGLRVLTKIQNIIRQELDAAGANEILMPALTQEDNYIKTGRNEALNDILFRTEGQGGTKLVLNPTHEEIVTPLVQKHVFSYQDLPVAVYQIQNKFRNEPRAKSGLLRGREFSMKDLYSFHTSQEDLDSYYEKMQKVYDKIYDRLGLGDLTVMTYASGGTFCKYSHEFQTISEMGEDTIYLCEKCRIAVNEEIIKEQHTCPACGNKNLIPKKAIEVGNIFILGAKFTSSFDFTVTDEAGKEIPVLMGCYGIGPSRIMGTLAEVYNDERGIIWPKNVAPYQVHLIALGKEEQAAKEADKIYEQLIKEGIEVLYDDRINVSAGEKLADADLLGMPYRVIVSPKTLEKKVVEFKERSATEPKFIALSKLIKELK